MRYEMELEKRSCGATGLPQMLAETIWMRAAPGFSQQSWTSSSRGREIQRAPSSPPAHGGQLSAPRRPNFPSCDLGLNSFTLVGHRSSGGTDARDEVWTQTRIISPNTQGGQMILMRHGPGWTRPGLGRGGAATRLARRTTHHRRRHRPVRTSSTAAGLRPDRLKGPFLIHFPPLSSRQRCKCGRD